MGLMITTDAAAPHHVPLSLISHLIQPHITYTYTYLIPGTYVPIHHPVTCMYLRTYILHMYMCTYVRTYLGR